MKALLTASIMALCARSYAALPQSWEGLWKGSCAVAPAYQGINGFDASIEIKRLGQDSYGWRITYDFHGQIQTQVRTYELKAAGDQSGHYVIDEKNGLLLDTYAVGDTLLSSFTINGQLLTTYYRFSSEGLTVSMPSYGSQPVRNTCLNSNGQMCAGAFGLRTIQACNLKK